MSGARKVEMSVLQGVEGASLYIGGQRVAGPKPWGGGTLVARWNVEVGEILEALNAPDPWEGARKWAARGEENAPREVKPTEVDPIHAPAARIAAFVRAVERECDAEGDMLEVLMGHGLDAEWVSAKSDAEEIMEAVASDKRAFREPMPGKAGQS